VRAATVHKLFFAETGHDFCRLQTLGQ
jgi:hypothetical protein